MRKAAARAAAFLEETTFRRVGAEIDQPTISVSENQ
jgi:hypothetical protein